MVENRSGLAGAPSRLRLAEQGQADLVMCATCLGNRFGRFCSFAGVFAVTVVGANLTTSLVDAQTVTASVNVNNTLAILPEYGMGVHTSVYDGGLRYEGSPVFTLLDGALDDAGVDVLRYPGGGYADGFHFLDVPRLL